MMHNKKFFFGAATSSHQVEGGNRNDWSEWETKNAGRLSRESGGVYPPENYISGAASDHYNRYEEDFDIARELGHTAHRFSLEWSRIEPEEGVFNKEEIEHYRMVFQALRARGMEPFVTLWHWTLPLWLRDTGGVASKEFPKLFARYAERMAYEFKNEVTIWITINESQVFASNAHLRGVWPPQHKNIFSYISVVQNLIRTHKQAYQAIKRTSSMAQIGIAKNNVYFDVARGTWINCTLKRLADWWWNDRFLDYIQNDMDFIGLNYYFHNRIDNGFNKNKNHTTSDMGWEVYPRGLRYVLLNLKKYNKPIYIVENGIADAKDVLRADFIKESIRYTFDAKRAGVDVRGYFYWSLLDNFEWDKGFWPRFGLIEIDYKTMERKIRQSAYTYRDSITRYTGSKV